MDPRVSIIDKRLNKIKRIIAVSSGKGGVGKSLVSSLISLNLSEKGYKVGLLDLDIYGPSTHLILGIKDLSFPEEKKGIIPYKFDKIKFMSIVFFTKDKPAPLRGIDITNTIIELLTITQWKELDYLIIDLPPGIGDETLDLIRLVKKTEFLVITTYSKVSMGAVSKLLLILKELNLPIVGVIENMKMDKLNYIKNSIRKLDVGYLGFISFDPNIEYLIGDSINLLKNNIMQQLDEILRKHVLKNER